MALHNNNVPVIQYNHNHPKRFTMRMALMVTDSFTKANAALRKLETADIPTDDALDTSDSEAIRSRKRPQRFIEDFEEYRKQCFW